MNAPRSGLAAMLVLAAAIFPPVLPARGGEDVATVRAIALRQAEAWNKHDAAAYSGLFTPDCDVVNIVGWWWKSRAEMQARLTRAFASVFRDSQLTFTDVRVEFIRSDVAVAHASWKMTGTHMPPGLPSPDHGIQTLVMTKHAGQWRIAVFQNTLSKPERPFPAGLPVPTH
ncbi:MAG: SgcJ/EcaC family oxidoreductase [Rhodanobacteraceae bacterium]